MKKAVLLSIILCLLIIPASARNKTAPAPKPSAETIKKQLAEGEKNIKLLANALELYANEHYREYPKEEEFFAEGFKKYIVKAAGRNIADTAPVYQCPGVGRIKYIQAEKTLAFKISCPQPDYYGLKALYFSSSEGFVKKGDSVAKTAVAAETKPPEQKKWEDVTEQEKEEMIQVITSLHKAYEEKNLDLIMEIQKEAVVRSGLEMEKKGKYTAEEVYFAYKGTANDVLRAEGYGMKPVNLKAAIFRKRDNTYQVYSMVPILETNRVAVGTMKVQLRISTFDFERDEDDGKMRIVKMQLY